MKIKKKKKSKGQRGNNSYGHGARKKWKGSGHHGGCGMAGTGKRADHKKSMVIKLYGNKYFGKQGETSKGTERKKAKVINLDNIQKNIEALMKKYGKGKELVLSEYKILGEGEITQAVTIKARCFSESAKQKIEKAGGQAILAKEKVEKEAPVKETKKPSEKDQKPAAKKTNSKENAVKEIKKK
ncbi:50S ribosomal protein L15 [uncultured archaeon]|nr:50S ribosomal protein L15 [uncultured archaeon]